MNREELLQYLKQEEEMAHMKGWDFSYINDRYEEEDELPWDFKSLIQEVLTDVSILLDMETGGGEFLRSLGHPFDKTYAIEAYPPNVQFCKEELLPLGIHFLEADGEETLPFKDETFDVVTNRHGSYLEEEVYRVLKPGGYFLTQQVGADNDKELIELLTPEHKTSAFPEHYLEKRSKALKETGFNLLKEEEVYQPIRFYDLGALVWFAKIIEWEFEGFSVETHKEHLFKAQEILEEKGVLEGQIHRYLLVASKPE